MHGGQGAARLSSPGLPLIHRTAPAVDGWCKALNGACDEA
jgi:hypothetical protein